MEFITFLFQNSRLLSPATVANHVGAILYALKFIHKESSPKFSDIKQIEQLRQLSTELQKAGDDERPKTKADFQELGRWLEWDKLLEAVKVQRGKYYAAQDEKKRAEELQRLIILALYTHLPPSRSLELRRLRVVQETDVPSKSLKRKYKAENIMYFRLDGSIQLILDAFKNRKSFGRDHVDIEVSSVLGP